MTEAEWLASNDPRPMLRHLRKQGVPRRKAGRRRLRLFGCACCRRVWHLLKHERSRHAVAVAERLADGLAGRREQRDAWWAAGRVAGYWVATPRAPRAAERVIHARAWAAAWGSRWAAVKADEAARGTRSKEERRHQADLLRCVFGNPFRPAELEAAWLQANDGAAARVAQAIYEEGTFDRVSVLGDALEDAGCADEGLLGHCRSGAHVRGCWVVDMVRGKG